MGHILSGGGGGNSHNAGGGGGSNFSIGGDGGEGWPTCTPSAGGIGGVDLFSSVSTTRFFLGGGGGAGEANNGGSQDAGNGGGLIFITAEEIETTGTCSSRIINSNGESITTGSGNDGNSGGGVGGSIYFYVETWNVGASCPLTINSNGGKGGDVTHQHHHGGGGGGGLGAVIYAKNQPGSNVTTNTEPGVGESNCSTCTVAAPGGGVNQDGIVIDLVTLPVELIHFDAQCNNDYVTLEWITAAEFENEGFTIQTSYDGRKWDNIDYVNGMGNTSSTTNYQIEIPFNNSSLLYRLKQTDYDGDFSYSKSVSVDCSVKKEVIIYPNPTRNNFSIINTTNNAENTITIVNALGQTIQPNITRTSFRLDISLQDYPNGIYSIIITGKSGQQEMHQIVLVK